MDFCGRQRALDRKSELCWKIRCIVKKRKYILCKLLNGF